MTTTTTQGPSAQGPSAQAGATEGDTPPGHDHGSCAGCLDRRQLLTRAGGVGLAAAGVAVLAACGSSSTPSSGAPAAGGTDGAPGGDAGSDGPLAQVADIPVGGALLVESQKILLVQATEGTITAVGSVCTHQGCTVLPAEGNLSCPCHSSTFAFDGAPVSGPADEPLPSVDVHVKDGAVYLGTA